MSEQEFQGKRVTAVKADALDGAFVAIRKVHVFYISLIGILSPIAAGYSTYANAVNKASVAEMNQKFTQLRLENEEKFVKKDDVKTMQAKLSEIQNEVSEMRGELRSYFRRGR